MSSKKRKATKTNEGPSKRRRTTGANTSFGAPNEDDSPYSSQVNAPSSSAFCTRDLHPTVPTLTTLCIRRFATNLKRLTREEYLEQEVHPALKSLPDALLQRVFSALKSSCPEYLGHGFISSIFLRCQSLELSNDLPGVKQITISAIPRANASLRELTLVGFEQFPDNLFAGAIRSLPELTKLNLRGCTKVGSATTNAILSCVRLSSLNLSYTSTSPVHVAPIIKNLDKLEVLKLASMFNCSDNTMIRPMEQFGEDFQQENLKTLKLRQNNVSETSLGPLIQAFPNLRRLDLSFTSVRHLLKIPFPSTLQKLLLTSSQPELTELLEVLVLMPELEVLSLGALDSSTSVGGMKSSAPFTSDSLRSLSTVLETLPQLRSVSLVGNTNIGRFDRAGEGSALGDFIRRVGRKCLYLNLAKVQHLRSHDLSGLMSESTSPPRVTTLVLNGTNVDDDATPYIAACPNLTTLEVAATKITRNGLFHVIDSCAQLERLDVTGCRGIRLTDRRRIFELWHEDRGASLATPT